MFQTPSLDFSLYLVGNSKADLEKVRAYLIKTHPDRSEKQFDLKPLNEKLYALMIFDEMISRRPKLQNAVRKYGEEHDSEYENEFWQLSDPNNLTVAVLAYYPRKVGDKTCFYQLALIKKQGCGDDKHKNKS